MLAAFGVEWLQLTRHLEFLGPTIRKGILTSIITTSFIMADLPVVGPIR
jgi:hypothetical protein